MEDQTINKKKVFWAIVLLGLLVLGTWFYSEYGKNKDVVPETPNGEVQGISIERIDAKHQWKNGKHVIVGEIEFPNPCYILSTNTTVAESMPEQVTIAFKAETSGEVCAQVITKERFKVEFNASKDASIKATWNGKPVILNLIPAGANEDLENFEIYIKG